MERIIDEIVRKYIKSRVDVVRKLQNLLHGTLFLVLEVVYQAICHVRICQ